MIKNIDTSQYEFVTIPKVINTRIELCVYEKKNSIEVVTNEMIMMRYNFYYTCVMIL